MCMHVHYTQWELARLLHGPYDRQQMPTPVVSLTEMLLKVHTVFRQCCSFRRERGRGGEGRGGEGRGGEGSDCVVRNVPVVILFTLLLGIVLQLLIITADTHTSTHMAFCIVYIIAEHTYIHTYYFTYSKHRLSTVRAQLPKNNPNVWSEKY